MRLFHERILDIIADYDTSARTFADTWIAVHELNDPYVTEMFDDYVSAHIDTLTLRLENISGIAEDDLQNMAEQARNGNTETAKTLIDLGYEHDAIVNTVANYLAGLTALGLYPKAWERFTEEVDAEIDMRQC